MDKNNVVDSLTLGKETRKLDNSYDYFKCHKLSGALEASVYLERPGCDVFPVTASCDNAHTHVYYINTACLLS